MSSRADYYSGHGRMAIGITTTLMLLSTVVVFLRLYIRCIQPRGGSARAGWDDLTVFISWVMAVGASGATYAEIDSGLGRHMNELSRQQLRKFELSLFIVLQFYNIGLNTVKISYLCQYHRIFPHRAIRTTCFYYGIFCFVWMVGQAILYALSCVPIAGIVPSLANVCLPTLPVWTAISSINVLTDLVIFSIPLKPLWSMSLLKRQRYLLIGIFCIGFLVCIISIVRIPTLRQGASSPDPTFTNVSTALWSLAELQAAIVCTSLPILRPIVAKFVRGIGSSNHGNVYPHERSDRSFAGRPAQPQKQPEDESPLYSTDPLGGSTLKSTTPLAPRTDDLYGESRERESNSQQRSTSPPVVVKLRTVTIVDIGDENSNNRQDRGSSMMVLRGSLSTTHGTTANSITTPSHSPSHGVPEATPARPPSAARRARYSASLDQNVCRMYPRDLRSPYPGPEAGQALSVSHAAQSTADSRQCQATVDSSPHSRARDSWMPSCESTLWTPTTTATLAASPREMHSSVGAPLEVDLIKDRVERTRGKYEGKSTKHHGIQNPPLLDAHDLDAEESSSIEEVFGLSMIPLPKPKRVHPAAAAAAATATSWLRLTPEPGEDP